MFKAILKYLFHRHTHEYSEPTDNVLDRLDNQENGMIWERECECGDTQDALFDANGNCVAVRHNGGEWNE
jgi:hypothetical protein